MSIMGSTTTNMNMNESGLWLPGTAGSTTKEDKIEKWWEVNRKHDPPLTRGATPLVERCMRILGWKQPFAERTLKGYRQFMELKSVMNDWQATKLTAPLAIQQMWEQHLLDNLNYTDDCFLLFGRVIGHDPDSGLNERATIDRVKTTKIAFQARYGADLDPEVWEFGAPDMDNGSNGGTGLVSTGSGGGTIDATDDGHHYAQQGGHHVQSTPRGRLAVASHAVMAAGGMGGGHHQQVAPQQQQQQPPMQMQQSPQPQMQMQQPPVVPQQQQQPPLHHESPVIQHNTVPIQSSGNRDVSMSPRARSLVASSDDENTPIVSRPTSPPRPSASGSRGSNAFSNNSNHGSASKASQQGRSPKSPSGNDPITIFLRDTNSGEETYFSLRYRSTLRIVFTVFAERKGLSQDNLKFSFNGQSLTGYETPYSLGLEDRARIDVQIGR